jgi:hypothetical protein
VSDLSEVNQDKYSADPAKGRCAVPNLGTVRIMGTVRIRMTPHRTMVRGVTGTRTRTGHDTEGLIRIEPFG